MNHEEIMFFALCLTLLFITSALAETGNFGVVDFKFADKKRGIVMKKVIFGILICLFLGSLSLSLAESCYPTPPVDLMARQINQGLLLSWSTPTFIGDDPLVGYEVSVNDGKWEYVSSDGDFLYRTESNTTFSQYKYKVRAVTISQIGQSNEMSFSLKSADMELIPAPRITKLNHDNSQITIVWEQEDADLVSEYLVLSELNGVERHIQTVQYGATECIIPIASVEPDSIIEIRVISSQGIGSSTFCMPAIGDTPQCPTNLKITIDNSKLQDDETGLDVSWDKPIDDRRLPLRGYYVEFSGGQTSMFISPENTNLTIMTNDLLDIFSISLKAVNDVGMSDAIECSIKIP